MFIVCVYTDNDTPWAVDTWERDEWEKLPPWSFQSPLCYQSFHSTENTLTVSKKTPTFSGRERTSSSFRASLNGFYFDKSHSTTHSQLYIKWNDFLKDPIVSWMSRFTEKDEWEVSKLIMTTNPSVLHSSKNLLPSAITLGQKLRFAWRSILFNLTPN